MKDVVLTGIRVNNEPTLGNYLGAIKPMVNIASSKLSEYQFNMFVPDLHSLTTPIDYRSLENNTISILKIYVASGLPINSSNVLIYRQSYIPAHSELSWILSCFTGFGEASRMVEFKDKSKRLSSERVSVGLFNYPILMSSDILLYDAKWVPVGDDQRQHLELCIKLAERFNAQFGKTFTVPMNKDKQNLILERLSSPRIRSLKNPMNKMSKSINDPSGTILLSENPKLAAKKILSATTDSFGEINYDWDNQPGISNLLEILSLLSNKSIDSVKKDWVGKKNYGELKATVAEYVELELIKIQNRFIEVDESDITNKLKSDEFIARKISNKKLSEVQYKVGLRNNASKYN